METMRREKPDRVSDPVTSSAKSPDKSNNLYKPLLER